MILTLFCCEGGGSLGREGGTCRHHRNRESGRARLQGGGRSRRLATGEGRMETAN